MFDGVKEITCSSTMCNVGVPPRTNMIGTSDCQEISFSRTQSQNISMGQESSILHKEYPTVRRTWTCGFLVLLPRTDPDDILKVPDSAFEN